MSVNFKFIGALTVAILLASCASKPVNMPAISSNASSTAEIEKTEHLISEAKQQQVDVLSPKNFQAAERSLAKAKKMKEKNKDDAEINEELAYAQAF